jgi:hypothetical protein
MRRSKTIFDNVSNSEFKKIEKVKNQNTEFRKSIILHYNQAELEGPLVIVVEENGTSVYRTFLNKVVNILAGY